MKDVKSLLDSAVKEYGFLYGVTRKSAKQASFGEIVLPEGIHALRSARDILIVVGDILEEDLIAGRYTAAVKAGAANSNTALVVALAEGRVISLAACAKEGLINQSTAKRRSKESRRLPSNTSARVSASQLANCAFALLSRGVADLRSTFSAGDILPGIVPCRAGMGARATVPFRSGVTP